MQVLDTRKHVHVLSLSQTFIGGHLGGGDGGGGGDNVLPAILLCAINKYGNVSLYTNLLHKPSVIWMISNSLSLQCRRFAFSSRS